MNLVYSLEEIDSIAHHLISQFGTKKYWLFSGNLGAGKTTLINAICNSLGIESLVNSPTFNIINKYVYKKTETLLHIDLYRIKSLEELQEMGFVEQAEKANFVWIEWPELIQNFVNPNNCLKLTLEKLDLTKRELTLDLC